jgi:hypothetical protein
MELLVNKARAVAGTIPHPVGHAMSVGMGPQRRRAAATVRACRVGAGGGHLREHLVGAHAGGAQRLVMGHRQQHHMIAVYDGNGPPPENFNSTIEQHTALGTTRRSRCLRRSHGQKHAALEEVGH